MKNLNKEESDIIIFDPSVFIKYRGKKQKTIQGYKRLGANTIRKVKPRVIIVKYSYSQVVGK